MCVLIAFLKLRERRVVLKYLHKLTEKIDSCTADELEVPEWCTKVSTGGGLAQLVATSVGLTKLL